MAYAELAVGQVAELTHTVTDQDIRGYAEITGDRNPAHTDEGWAARSRFKGRIAHGMLTAGFISAVLGMKLPGAGAIYLSQTLRFLKPVRPGDQVTARAEILELFPAQRRVRIATRCTNQAGEVVLDGEALLLVDDVPDSESPIPSST
jgi:3-hydroxybutyryl-CoA dehydratase